MTQQQESPSLRAIIFSNRSSLRDTCRSELKNLGMSVETLFFPETLTDCMKMLEEQRPTILVLDWGIGIEESLKILESSRAHQQQDTRYTFLVTSQLDEKVIAAGTEYGVMQIHTGAITQTKIKMALAELINEAHTVGPIQQLLIKVAEARRKDDWNSATDLLKKLFEKDPKNSRIITELADNYIHDGKWEEALKMLTPLQNMNPPYVRALHLTGKCLIKLGKAPEACSVLKKAKIINPYNIERLLELGSTFLNLGHSEAAKENFDDVISFAPDNNAAKNGKGTCLLIEGEVNEALSLLREIRSDRELASIFNTAAILAIRLGNFDKGIGLYDSAIKALGDDKLIMARLFFNKGLGFFRFRKKDQAKECFQKALQFDPSFKNAQHNLDALKGLAKASSKLAEESGASLEPGKDLPQEEDLVFDFDDSLEKLIKDDLANEDERF